MTINVYALPFKETSGQVSVTTAVSSLQVSVRNFKFGSLTERAVVNFDSEHGARVFSIPFVVPESFEVSYQNWPELFRMERTRSAKFNPKPLPTIPNEILPSSVVWNSRKSPICVVTMSDGWKYALYITDAKDPTYLSFKTGDVTFIRKDMESREVDFTSRNLRLSHNDGGRTSYILPFRNQISPEEMLMRWVKKDFCLEDRLDLYDADNLSATSLKPKSFFGFNYFEVFQGKVIFTLQKHPAIRAVDSVVSHIRSMANTDSIMNSRLRTLTDDYHRVTMSDDPDKTKAFLQYVVSVHEDLEAMKTLSLYINKR
jgi:hypothetical protein